jgi:hypothetical protein
MARQIDRIFVPEMTGEKVALLRQGWDRAVKCAKG